MSDWVEIPQTGDISPYIHWWDAFERPRFAQGTVDLAQAGFGENVTRSLGKGSADILAPLPKEAINTDYARFLKQGGDWLDAIEVGRKKGQFAQEDLPPEDAVVIGIIDAAIALGHQRFMFKDGASTRFLTAWQMAAPKAGISQLPYGQELTKPEIDALITAHSKGGTLDEDAFNAAANLIDLINPMGQREGNHSVAHGSHVLDLAAGFDPTDPKVTDKMLKRRPIIAVNLPNRFAIGSNGIFLESFVIQAIARIVEVSDKLWSQRKGLGKKEQARGYPIVINLSYGLHAGPKDGSMAVERFITDLTQRRKAEGKAPLRVVLPAGNENQDAGHAVCTLTAKTLRQRLNWRILPEDQTPNYLEIWSDALSDQMQLPLNIKLTAPDGTTSKTTVGQGPLSYLDVGPFARIYCQARKGQGAAPARQRYLICVAPTLAYEPGTQTAPSGLWQVEVSLDTKAGLTDLDIFAYVQSDQSTRPAGENGQLSYLEHENYEVYDADGAAVDTYRYTRAALSAEQADREPLARTGPVQRKGTLNAIASLRGAVVVAGHRVSDGRPASYSATGAGARFADAPGSPTVSYPSDEGPVHPGLLAAGSRSGTAVVMQGTSFATALATRDIADLLQGWHPGDAEQGTDDAMRALAQKTDLNDGSRGRIFALKSGAGRMSGLPNQRMPRYGQN